MKQLLGVDIAGTARLNKVAKTVTFSGIGSSLTLENILVVNDATANTLIYNFADPSSGAVSFANNVLTLDYNTNVAAMSNTDQLQVWLDMPQETAVVTKDSNSADSLLTRIYHLLTSPMGYDKSLARQRSTAVIESGTVTTVSTVSNIAGVGGYSAQQSIYDTSKFAWANTVRNRIT